MHHSEARGSALVIVIVVLAVLGFAAVLLFYDQYAETRLIGPSGPRIMAKTGETHAIQYKTSSRIPSVKIDLCRERLPPKECVTLAQKVTGQSANVRIPHDYPLGKALLVVWERKVDGKLSGKMQTRRQLLVTQGSLSPSPSPTSYSGAGSSPKSVVSERVGRRLEIIAPEPMIVGARVPVTINYRANSEPGTYRGELQMTQITSPDIFNMQPPRLADTSGGVMRWSYELQAGQTFMVTFEVKVPPRSYRGDSLRIQAQAGDSAGPLVSSSGVWTALEGEWRITEK